MMDDKAIEALLDEMDIPFGRLTRFNNGNCFITTWGDFDDIKRRMEIAGFADVVTPTIEGHTLVWFRVPTSAT